MEKGWDDFDLRREQILTDFERWFEARQRFSHDVLKNRVMNAFGHRHCKSLELVELEPYLGLFVAQEQDFRTFLTEATIVLRPGTWLANWMGNRLDVQTAAVLREFLNLDFENTSSLFEKCKEIEEMLELALAAARRVLETQSIDANATSDLETLIGKLSDAFTELPSSMLQVVESMR
jgi:hypothetical protein